MPIVPPRVRIQMYFGDMAQHVRPELPLQVGYDRRVGQAEERYTPLVHTTEPSMWRSVKEAVLSRDITGYSSLRSIRRT